MLSRAYFWVSNLLFDYYCDVPNVVVAWNIILRNISIGFENVLEPLIVFFISRCQASALSMRNINSKNLLLIRHHTPTVIHHVSEKYDGIRLLVYRYPPVLPQIEVDNQSGQMG